MFAGMTGSKLAGGTNAREILCDKACRIGDCADIPQTRVFYRIMSGR